MGPNHPDIALQVSQHALNSDSESEEEVKVAHQAADMAALPNTPNESGALQNYQAQMMEFERQNKERLKRVREEQENEHREVSESQYRSQADMGQTIYHHDALSQSSELDPEDTYGSHDYGNGSGHGS